MKISTRVCDVCGNTIYQHARHTYEIRKRMWEVGELGNRLDLCEDCWRKFVVWVNHKYVEEEEDEPFN